MRIGLVAQGSRGDVQPFVALGRALVRSGAEVELAAPESFAALVERAGLAFVPMPGDVHALMRSERRQRVLARGDALTWAREMWAFVAPRWDSMASTVGALAARSDALVVHALSLPFALATVALERTPLALGLLVPAGAPTGAYPSPVVTARDLGAWGNRATHVLAERALWSMHASRVARRREREGLPALRGGMRDTLARAGAPTLHAWDEALLPHASDLPGDVMATGEWAMDVAVDAPIDGALEAWLGEDAPTIYVGFGSLPMERPEATIEMVADVSARLGVRALVSSGWTAPRERAVPPHVRVTSELDHARVLPRCVAAVHHGGVGTTHACLRAGLPSVITPVYADQPFWAARMRELGVATSFPRRALERARLERALTEALRMRERARALGARMQSDGAQRAARVIRERLG